MLFNQSTLESRIADTLSGNIPGFSLSISNWKRLDTTRVDDRFEDKIITDEYGTPIKHVVRLTKAAKKEMKARSVNLHSIKKIDVEPRTEKAEPVAAVEPSPVSGVTASLPPISLPSADYVTPPEWQLFEQILENTNANVWLTGHAGCGKDMMVKQYAAVNGKRLYQINCRRDMSPDIFFGRYVIENHTMKFVPGLIEQAMTDPDGGILFIDEAASMPAEVAISLNRLLEESDVREFVIDCDGGRIVRSTPGFKIILASNTIGRGFEEATAAYSAQSDEMDGSLHSRISATIEMDFNLNLENNIIKQLIKQMVSRGGSELADVGTLRNSFKTLIKNLRDAAEGGFMALPFSTRNLISIKKLYDAGLPFNQAISCAYISRLTKEEKAVVDEQLKLCFAGLAIN